MDLFYRRAVRAIVDGLASISLLGGLGCAAPSPSSSSEDPGQQSPRVLDVARASRSAPAPAQPEPSAVIPKWTPDPSDVLTPHRALEHPERLASFFERLAAVDDGAVQVVRVLHLGASMIGADDLTAVLRTKFQTRFGDGGAGLVLLQRYMPNYLHRSVELQAHGWQHCYIAFLCKSDGHYGLGGTTFWSDGGASTVIRTRDDTLGGSVSQFEIWFVGDPRGGQMRVRVDSDPFETIPTRSEDLEDRYHRLTVDPGPHKIKIVAGGGGRVRGYGVVLETDGPGITWEQFSMLGAFTRRMLAWDAEHIAGQIAHRDPDLIVFTYGGNDTRRVANGKLTREQYVQEYVESVQRVRAGKPEVACLITSMTDRAKSLKLNLRSEHTELIATAQRDVAEQAGCALFDSYRAMGGAGSLLQWRAMDPPLASGDLKHLNHRGRVKLGGWIYDAVITAYVEYRRSAPNTEQPPPPADGLRNPPPGS